MCELENGVHLKIDLPSVEKDKNATKNLKKKQNKKGTNKQKGEPTNVEKVLNLAHNSTRVLLFEEQSEE